MKSEEFPTTRVDWRLRAKELLKEVAAVGPALAVDYVADRLEETYNFGGGGICVHGPDCSECLL